MAESRDSGGHSINFIQVDAEEENPVNKAVILRCQPVMHHLALVQAGLLTRFAIDAD
jgi:hypothetical protein